MRLGSLTRIGTVALLAGSLLLSQEEDKDKNKKEEGLPLPVAETIRFTTDEGTWLSLDLSPDGQTIVFDLLGDIYTMPATGGKAKRIIGGISFEAQPRFSPDGQWIVFTSDRSGAENVWMAKPDGSGIKAVTKGRGPAMQMYLSPHWTPDGEYVIAAKSERGIGTYHPYLYHKDGGTGVSIGTAPPPPPAPGADGPPRPPQPNKMGTVASKDGRYFYWAQRSGAMGYNAMFPIWQIVRFDRNTGESVTLTNAPGSAMRPLLSPDGRHLVYATRHRTETSLRVRELESGEERWLIHGVTRDDQESRGTRDVFPGYAFFPDGKSLLVTKDGKIHRVDFATGKATLIPFSADVEAEIAARVYSTYRVDDSDEVKARLIRYPRLSPDGKQVAFTAFNKLFVMDLPNGQPRRVTSGKDGEFMPAWSPDGQWLAYVTWSRNGGHIYRVRSTGANATPQQLTRRPAYYAWPVYSPDSSKIVYQTGPVADQLLADLRGEHHEFRSEEEAILHGHAGEVTGLPPSAELWLQWIPSGGGAATVIGPSQRGRFPHFTNDPDRVFLTTPRGLQSVRLDGLDRRTHLKITGSGAPPSPAAAEEIRLSPDGTKAFAEVQGKHYLVTVPKAGKDTINVSVNSPNPAVPVKKLSAEGGDFLDWSRDGSTLTWSWGSRFHRQVLTDDSSESTAINVTQPRARPKGTVVLTGARIVTMRGDEVIERGDIVITGNRINAVGAKGSVTVPSGAKVIDVSGKTIIPGLVDAHAHMWPPRDAHQTQVWQYLANLAYGITTTRDPQSSTTDVFTYADMVETGEILGPRVYTTGPGVFSTSGLEDKDTTRNFIKRYKEAYNSMTLKQYVAGDRIVRQWVAMACREFGITPTTEGALDLKLNLTQMADGFSGHEHSLPIQPLYKDVIEFVARTKTYYTPTILVAYGAPWTENYWFENTEPWKDEKLRRFVPSELLDGMLRRRRQWFAPEEYGHTGIAKGVAAVVKAGGRAGLGGHGQLQGLGAHWELWSLQSGGLTPHEALRVATLFSAEAIGLQADVGSIDTGKLADLVVLNSNPLASIRNSNTVQYVMKNGELFTGQTLDQIWPVSRKLDPPSGGR